MFWELAWGLINILLIDLVLAGDNALIIAAATRNLHGRTKKIAMAGGAAVAGILRLVFLFIASWLLRFPYIYALGGAYIVFLAFFLLRDGKEHKEVKATNNLFSAIYIIASADVLMSLDNVLAVAGVAGGNVLLFVLGVCISIPLIFVAASLLSGLMERHQIVVLIGSLVLARVGGKMIAEEKTILRLLPSELWSYYLQAIAVVLVFIFYVFIKTKHRK